MAYSVGPLTDRNLVIWSRRWESERRKEANIPWVMQPASALQGISLQLQRGSCRPTEHSDKVFRTLSHFRLRISEGFYLSPSGEIIGLMSPRVVLPGDLQSRRRSSSRGSCCFVSILKVGGPVWSNFLRKNFVGSIWGNTSITLSL